MIIRMNFGWLRLRRWRRCFDVGSWGIGCIVVLVVGR
jgi:hypothetical protein